MTTNRFSPLLCCKEVPRIPCQWCEDGAPAVLFVTIDGATGEREPINGTHAVPYSFCGNGGETGTVSYYYAETSGYTFILQIRDTLQFECNLQIAPGYPPNTAVVGWDIPSGTIEKSCGDSIEMPKNHGNSDWPDFVLVFE